MVCFLLVLVFVFFSWGSYPLDDVSVTDSFVISLVMYISADAAQ